MDGDWELDQSGAPATFHATARSGIDTDSDRSDGNSDAHDDTYITTANGIYAYNHDWNDIERSARPTHAAARFPHFARQRTDTSRWLSMCWPSDAVSLLGRACDLDTGKAYELTRQLSDHSVTYLHQLWQLSLDRRRARNDSTARQAVWVEWNETKQRLGTTGRNAKRKLMPIWVVVAQQPLES